MATRAIAIFCDDIREEKSGQDTLIGIFPDNMSAPSFPGAIPKLGIYLRIQFDADDPPKAIAARLNTPWGEVFKLGEGNEELISRAVGEAIDHNIPIAGIIMKMVFAPFRLPSAGAAKVTVTIDGEDKVCGIMNILHAPTTSSTAPPPPP